MQVSPISGKYLTQLEHEIENGNYGKLKKIAKVLCSPDIPHTFIQDNPRQSWKLLRIFHEVGKEKKTAKKIFKICYLSGTFKEIKLKEDVFVESHDGHRVGFNSLILHYLGIKNLREVSEKYSSRALKIYRHVLHYGELPPRVWTSPFAELCETYQLSEDNRHEDCSEKLYHIIKRRCKKLTLKQFETIDEDLSGLGKRKEELIFKAAYHLLDKSEIPYRFTGTRKLSLQADKVGILVKQNQLAKYLRSVVTEAYIDSESQLESLGLSEGFPQITSCHIKCPLTEDQAEWVKEAFPKLQEVHFSLRTGDSYTVYLPEEEKASSVFSNLKSLFSFITGYSDAENVPKQKIDSVFSVFDEDMQFLFEVFHEQKITVCLPVNGLAVRILNGKSEVVESQGTIKLDL